MSFLKRLNIIGVTCGQLWICSFSIDIQARFLHISWHNFSSYWWVTENTQLSVAAPPPQSIFPTHRDPWIKKVCPPLISSVWNFYLLSNVTDMMLGQEFTLVTQWMSHHSLSRRCCPYSPSPRCTTCWGQCTGPNCTCTAAERRWAAGWRTSSPPRPSHPSSPSAHRRCWTWGCKRHFRRWIQRCCRCRRCSPPRHCRLRSRCNGHSLRDGIIY